jgi:hypothetical protein
MAVIETQPTAERIHLRKVVAQIGQVTRTFAAVAERYWQQQEANGVKTWKEQRSAFQRFVIPHWTGDVSKYGPQHVRDLVEGWSLRTKHASTCSWQSRAYSSRLASRASFPPARAST